MRFKAIEIINSSERNTSLDIFRGFAVFSVFLYHFDALLPFGFLGVDLFFVISGFLVSGLLLKDFEANRKINFFLFLLQRSFKIWPSYYAFLIIGNIFVYLTCSSFAPHEVIPIYDLKRYLFFYQNYTGLPQSNVFYHVWSLCVEEHFYILLPLLLIMVQNFKDKKKKLFLSVSSIIALGIIFKILVLYFTHSKDTYAATHNRIDALGWGVMLNLLNTYYPHVFKNKKRNRVMVGAGSFILVTAIVLSSFSWDLYNKVIFHTIVPLSFFLMIGGTYHLKTRRLKLVRIVAYYSYNLYLWHPVFQLFARHYFSNKLLAFIVYSFLSSIAAFLTTTLIEEPFLDIRKKVLKSFWIRRATKKEVVNQSVFPQMNLVQSINVKSVNLKGGIDSPE